MYILSNGKGSYIKEKFDGGYESTHDVSLAKKFDNRAKANNIKRILPNKLKRGRYETRYIEEPDDNKKVVIHEPQEKRRTSTIVKVKSVKPADSEFMKKICNQTIQDDNLNQVKSLADIIIGADERLDDLTKQQSKVDSEVSDMIHYIEHATFDLYSGWLALRALQTLLRIRRKVKDELNIIRKIVKLQIDTSEVRNIKSEIERLQDNTYIPRVLNGLFENAEIDKAG